MVCGLEDPRETALICRECKLDFGPGPKPDTFDYCEEHIEAIEAAMEGCNPNKRG